MMHLVFRVMVPLRGCLPTEAPTNDDSPVPPIGFVGLRHSEGQMRRSAACPPKPSKEEAHGASAQNGGGGPHIDDVGGLRWSW